MATTPQAISRVLKKAGYEISRKYKGKVTYMNTEGFQIQRNWRNEIVINYVFRTAGFSRIDNVTKKMELETAAVFFLHQRGYRVEKGEFGWNVTKD